MNSDSNDRAYLKPLTLGLMAFLISNGAHAQLLLNEGNAVSDTEGPGFLTTDSGSPPYEGFDYGVLPFSGNTNPPNGFSPGIPPNPPFFPGQDPGPEVPPGNPFPADLSTATGVQTSFVDGFDTVTNPRGFGRIQFNGGEWIELTVTDDHTDLRGFTFYWQDDANSNGTFGELEVNESGEILNERGAVTFSQDQAWSNLRAGTIITITQEQFVDEVRDEFPFGAPTTDLDDTGFDYDLSTDLSFDPFDGNDDFHINFHLDESVTNGDTPADTQFFLANSDLEVSNDGWAARIFNASSNLINQVLDDSIATNELDTETGAITDFIGENASGVVNGTFGTETDAGGIGDDEAFALLSNPDSEETGNGFYEDLDWSTFGLPNLFNARTDAGDTDGDGIITGDIVSGAVNDESTLGQVQDFSGLRDDIVRANTYDFVAGNTDFTSASSFELANDNSTPGAAPDATWSVRLLNNSGGAEVASVSADTTIGFLEISASNGTAALDVQDGVTLTVAGGVQPGRVLVDDGGIVGGDGTIDAVEIELFGGTAAPGSSVGELTITGDYIQNDGATLEIEIGGFADGEFDVLTVLGDAILDGELEISLVEGFTPLSSGSIEVLAATSVLGDLTLTGDTTGFSLVIDGDSVSLDFIATTLPGDFNQDGVVDAADYVSFRDNFGGPAGVLGPGDVVGGVIGLAQFATFVDNFGAGSVGATSPAVVPEPSAGLLVSVFVSAIAAVTRRRVRVA